VKGSKNQLALKRAKRNSARKGERAKLLEFASRRENKKRAFGTIVKMSSSVRGGGTGNYNLIKIH